MANPFTAQSERNNNVRRDLHDLSFQWNGSIPFGRRNVVLCQEVLPGQSFRIKPTFGLRTLPLVFPTQTRVRAALHFFYVRNRLLWKDWQDFIFHTKDGLVPPTLAKSSPVKFGSGSLSDALGVPSTIYTPTAIKLSGSYVRQMTSLLVSNSPYLSYPLQPRDGLTAENASNLSDDFPAVIKALPNDRKTIALYVDLSKLDPLTRLGHTSASVNYHILSKDVLHDTVAGTGSFSSIQGFYYDGSGTLINSKVTIESRGILLMTDQPSQYYSFNFNLPLLQNEGARHAIILYTFKNPAVAPPSSYRRAGWANKNTAIWEMPTSLTLSGVDLSALSADNNPFLNGQRPLSALPYRAVEYVFNAFYRNQQIDPFKIDGVVEYNKFIPTDAGGPDATDYDFHNSYWEMDAFTSCLTAPQQGPSPMVGVYPTKKGAQQIAFKDEDGNVRNVTPHMSEDGKTLISMDVTDAQNDVTLLDTRAAFEQGFVINDLRNVNALQKYLEMSQRKGYRYRDLMAGHYDVDIRYDELNYPEFLGGTAKDMYVNTVVATARTAGTDGVAPVELGDYAGTAGVAGDCAPITKYCDEHGFIIGILTVTPVPVYTQTLKPMFTRLSHLDYFTPEFANIGMQPVTKDLLAPLEYYLSKDRTGPIFGYQQPWWSYKRNLDEAHGLYRTQLRGFLLHRVFKEMPSLGADFITCDPTQLNDIFSTSFDNGDKLFGEIYFDIETKSPVPFISVASIE